MKWSFPHFDYRGMMSSMAPFKAHCACAMSQPRAAAERASTNDAFAAAAARSNRRDST